MNSEMAYSRKRKGCRGRGRGPRGSGDQSRSDKDDAIIVDMITRSIACVAGGIVDARNKVLAAKARAEWRLQYRPTIGIAHTFCASRDFARFKTMRTKQNLATDLGIQKENWG